MKTIINVVISMLCGAMGGYLYCTHSQAIQEKLSSEILKVKHIEAESLTLTNIDTKYDKSNPHGLFVKKQDETTVMKLGYANIFGTFIALYNQDNKDLFISNSKYSGPKITFYSGAEPIMERPSIIIGETSIVNPDTGTETTKEASIGIFNKKGKVLELLPRDQHLTEQQH
ncbi:MAG: hypothetical protein ACQETL_19865 [Bacteroidota bacterium]